VNAFRNDVTLVTTTNDIDFNTTSNPNAVVDMIMATIATQSFKGTFGFSQKK